MNYIKDGICYITFPDGKMTLVMDKFFPAPKYIIQKLFQKTIALNWKERQQITDEIIQWMEQKIEKLPDSLDFYANAFADVRTEMNELLPRIERMGRLVQEAKDYMSFLPRGQKKNVKPHLDERKAKLKELKENMSALRKDAKWCQSKFNEAKALEEKFKDNIELIERLTVDWW